MTLDELAQRYRLTSLPMAVLCVGLSFLLAAVISKANTTTGVLVLVGIVTLFILFLIFHSYQKGFLLLILYSFLMFHFYRLFPDAPYFPLGTLIEFFLALLFLSIIVHTVKNRNEIDKGVLHNPITYGLVIYLAYSCLLLFHPLSTGTTNRILALREILILALSFFITVHVLKTRQFIYFFTDYWIFLALIAGLYGVNQEVFGLTDWELRWLYSQPDQGKLAMVWGHIRKWSFLSDINAFGLLMSYGGIVCSLLALDGPFSNIKKFYLATCAIIMFAAMTFSGTRTAMAMVVFALVFYVAMTLNSTRSLLIILAFVIGVLALFFGPFYGPNFNRLRSTFDVKKDASMSVRDQTRARMQPYIREHALGGGFNTTGALGMQYEPDHPLAGKWDPDSGYLKTALERGWVGLLFQLGFYATILITGVNFYFRSRDEVARAYCCAYLCAFFALSVANYAQDSLDQKPTNLILMASFASLVTFSTSEQKNRNEIKTSSDKMTIK